MKALTELAEAENKPLSQVADDNHIKLPSAEPAVMSLEATSAVNTAPVAEPAAQEPTVNTVPVAEAAPSAPVAEQPAPAETPASAEPVSSEAPAEAPAETSAPEAE